tara:strand:+ start:120 stop:557 length:438 start_codon:yes stop_codon:yes gene_type:complete
MYQDLIILITLFFSVLWLIKKHYDNAWDIENIQIQLKNLEYKTSDFDKESEKDIASLRGETVNIVKSMREMQDDIIEGKQNDINIDAKYKLKLDLIDAMLEKYVMPNPKPYKKKTVTIHDAMQNRTSAEKAAYDKLAKQIAGTDV